MRDSKEELVKAPSTNESVSVPVDAKSNATTGCLENDIDANANIRRTITIAGRGGHALGRDGDELLPGSPFRGLLRYRKFRRT